MNVCEHNWSRAGERWAPFFACFWVCVATFDEAESGQCRRLGTDGYRHCMTRPATCVTAFSTSPAAQRWASCDDVAALRKRGQEYERGWVKSAARELDLMIEIERLKRELDREKSLRFGEYERSWIAEQEAMLASEDPEEREGARRSLAANKCKACCGTGLVAGEWLIDPDDPRYDNPPLCQCQNLEA